ncbi:type III secretion protein [Melaminivora suipulveris]|uniref:Type III secretion protein n=1 Tax=Melaminivora suipulveris TaxID=2109913 RepID=A0A2R3QFL5_9BURK|nr:EscF/YscF/HrpA family type III secretion system needle major subunit [Melaminivora suipulveris]AVO50549.1 type III secretion protein [Melaminivora suipulveris]
MTTGISFDSITSTLGVVGARRESELRTMIGGLNEQASTLDLLKLQQQIQQWTMFTQIQSTVTKEVADAMKGVIQKAA